MRIGPVLLACVVGAACSGSQRAPRAPTLTMRELGAEPRQLLRHAPAVGLEEQLELSHKLRIRNTFTNTTLDAGKHALDFPTTVSRGKLRVTGQSPDGEALISLTIDDVRVLDDVVDPRARHAMEAERTQLAGARVALRLAPNGRTEVLDVAAPNASASTREGLEAMRSALLDSFIEFPELEVGVGAVWHVRSERTISGITWERAATYALRDLGNDRAVIDVSVTMRAPAQDLRVEPNATTTLSSGVGTISGQVVVPLDGLVNSGSSTSSAEVKLSVTKGRLRMSSTVVTETFASLKRIEPPKPVRAANLSPPMPTNERELEKWLPRQRDLDDQVRGPVAALDLDRDTTEVLCGDAPRQRIASILALIRSPHFGPSCHKPKDHMLCIAVDPHTSGAFTSVAMIFDGDRLLGIATGTVSKDELVARFTTFRASVGQASAGVCPP